MRLPDWRSDPEQPGTEYIDLPLSGVTPELVQELQHNQWLLHQPQPVERIVVAPRGVLLEGVTING